MLDIQLIRRDPDAVRAALRRRGEGAGAAVDRVLELDQRWRAIRAELEELRAEQNRASKGRKGPPTPEEREQLAALAARGRALSDEETAVQAERERELASLPNLPADDAPDEDTVLYEVGEAGATGKDHLELAGDRIDMERGARLSGSRFAYLRGDLVMLELALVRFALQKLRGEGFEPVVPPVLVRERALYGTGFLPDTEQQIYRLETTTCTSSVPRRSRSRRSTTTRSSPRPICRSATPASRPASGARPEPPARTRAGSSGSTSSTRSRCSRFVAPAEAAAEHDRLLAIEESILSELQIPYRVVAIAVNDLGASAAKKYDCEAWLPGQGRYRELTSTSNTTDYQARRLGIRYRPAAGGRPEHVCTLNGTAVAVGRTIIALLENGQQEDGSVVLPASRALGAPRCCRRRAPAGAAQA